MFRIHIKRVEYMSRRFLTPTDILTTHTDAAVWMLICMDNSIRKRKHAPAWEKYGNYLEYANFLCQAHNAMITSKAIPSSDWEKERTIAIEGRDNKHFLHLGLVCLLLRSADSIPTAGDTHKALSELTAKLLTTPNLFRLSKYINKCFDLITTITTNLTSIASSLPPHSEQTPEQQMIFKACALALTSALQEIKKLLTESKLLNTAFRLSGDLRRRSATLSDMVVSLKGLFDRQLLAAEEDTRADVGAATATPP